MKSPFPVLSQFRGQFPNWSTSIRSIFALAITVYPLAGHAIAVVPFPGLDALTSSSSAIVVLRVSEGPGPMTSIGYPEDREVYIERLIKADNRDPLPTDTTVTVSIKGGDYTDSEVNELLRSEVPACLWSDFGDAAPGERYLVFLEKNRDPQSRALYVAINCSGAMLHLPRSYVSAISSGANARDAVRQIIKDAAAKCDDPATPRPRFVEPVKLKP